jgi:hypothetical protein
MQGKVVLKESLKQQEISAFKEYKNQMDYDDLKRQAEKHEREERIKKLINRTTNVTVEQQASKVELEIDRRVREQQEQREQFERMLANKKREDQKRQHDELKHRLEIQVQEKRRREMSEKEAEEEFHKQVIHKIKQDEELENAKLSHRKLKHLEFKNNLLLQMGQINNSAECSGIMSQMSPSSVAGGNPLNNRRRIAMDAMTQDELRIHKSIL